EHEPLAGGDGRRDIRGVGLVAQLRGEVRDGGLPLGGAERRDGCGGSGERVGHAADANGAPAGTRPPPRSHPLDFPPPSARGTWGARRRGETLASTLTPEPRA